MQYLVWYFILINLAGALATALDKWKAKRGAWRVPEKVLFAFCVLGACPGVYLTMRKIRHKTLHKRFMLGIPAIFILQLAIIFSIYYYVYRGI